ncbi:MAG TPA: HAD family acid phosphatase [Thermoanaerobaculia bacterium]|nr:HAD family acid phosphatase [Thermoanaerobaculia bacterium]
MRKLALLLLFAAACTTTKTQSPPCNAGLALVNATVWVQQGAEYRALALATYDAATRALDTALADPSWNAEEGTSDPSQPPAIIVDSDDTVFDNTPFEVRELKKGITYDEKDWTQWVAEASRDAVPGAAQFLAHAKSRGVTVFYITNRDIGEEEGTRQRIANLGFPLEANLDTILTRGERKEWTSDKSSRREFVAAQYRLLLLAGDDLNDFANARDQSIADRYKIVEDKRSWWNTKWFMLPNPMYGSWERPITGGTGTPCEQLQKKVDALRP